MENAAELIQQSKADGAAVLDQLKTRPEGLSQAEAESRLKQYGPNEIAREKPQSPLLRLLNNVKNPWSSCSRRSACFPT